MKEFSDILLLLAPLIIVSGAILLVVKKFFDHETSKRNIELKKSIREATIPIRLQAYERVILYLERTSPENLLFRVYKPGMSAKLFQNELLKTIRSEFEHNLTQQLYISSVSWELVKKSKEELIKIINISMTKLDDQANGIDLSKLIITQYSSIEKLPIPIALELLKKEVRQLF